MIKAYISKYIRTIIRKELKNILVEQSHDLKYALQLIARDNTVNWLLSENVPLHFTCEDRFELLSKALQNVTIKGLFLEFGVFKGETINYISEHISESLIYGFDSFEGLSEPWIYREVGAFGDVEGQMPIVNENVSLIKGFFQDTVPGFCEAHAENIAFIHIDSDLYSSANFLLTVLEDRIVKGTVVVFDEFFNYPGWKNGEYKAWREFVEKFKIKYEIIGFTYQRTAKFKSGNQVAFKILDKHA